MGIRSSLVAFLLCLPSCIWSPTWETPPEPKHGPKPTAAQLQSFADQWLEGNLKDPESRRVRWLDTSPRLVAIWGGYINSGWLYGWGMRFGVNAKNSFGGYTGEQSYIAMSRTDGLFVWSGPDSDLVEWR